MILEEGNLPKVKETNVKLQQVAKQMYSLTNFIQCNEPGLTSSCVEAESSKEAETAQIVVPQD